MRFWIGVTDNAWYDYLSELQPDEVNFWQPGGSSTFKAISPGEPFLFKLHSPLNYIVGGGYFLRHSFLPISLAWDAFREKNGADTYDRFRSNVIRLRKKINKETLDPQIGCIILAEPFFFQRDDWIEVPSNWSKNIVQGKTYDTNESIGASVWSQVEQRFAKVPVYAEDKEDSHAYVAEERPLYGEDYLTRARLGQGTFRVLVTETYNRKCAITGERTLPVLEASHIKPYAKSGPHRVNNGILLRADLHTLFDLGYMTISDDYHIEVSKRIKAEYHNGREYYVFHGKELINLPLRELERPSKEYIDWHNQNVYMP